MKKIYWLLFGVILIAGCSKKDPVLPGVRYDIFDSGDVVVENINVPTLGENEKNIFGEEKCDYVQDEKNRIFLGDKKIFSGFPTRNFVTTKQAPVCSGGFIYTGFNDGSVVKINPKNQRLIWMADVFKEHNLTGAAPMVDIVARVGVVDGAVLAGGLGDAFCKLNANNGARVWCVNISVPVDFVVVDDFAFVVGADNNLYAINIKNGRVYWKTPIKNQIAPKYNGEYVIVGKQKIDYKTGLLIK